MGGGYTSRQADLGIEGGLQGDDEGEEGEEGRRGGAVVVAPVLRAAQRPRHGAQQPGCRHRTPRCRLRLRLFGAPLSIHSSYFTFRGHKTPYGIKSQRSLEP